MGVMGVMGVIATCHFLDHILVHSAFVWYCGQGSLVSVNVAVCLFSNVVCTKINVPSANRLAPYATTAAG